MIYQLIYLALWFAGFGIAIAEHNKPKEGKKNAWTSIIAGILILFLLYKGGFFDCFFN